MGEPQLQETDKRAALEGLEEIFDVGVGQAQSEAHPAQDQAQSEAQAEAQELDSFKDRLLIELQSKVEALTWRNGYLESQLQERDKEIKLLTDSQHKSGWWARFCSWLASR